MDLAALPDIEDHITQLLSSSGQPKPLPQFVCYACPAIANDLEQLTEHVANQKHVVSKYLTSNSISCDLCDVSLHTLAHFKLHFYSKSHQVIPISSSS